VKKKNPNKTNRLPIQEYEWSLSPGKVEGEPVRFQFFLPVQFVLN
jgi:hypothetical protein